VSLAVSFLLPVTLYLLLALWGQCHLRTRQQVGNVAS